MELLIVMLAGYLIGAVPFAYVIGKLFYHTDVREHGSGNLGGSNTGRVLGRWAGVAVMTLDLLKVTFAAFLALKLSSHPWSMACAALAAGFGHCYPVYVRFRGGKAVAALYGYLFGLWILTGHSPVVFFLPLSVFLLVLCRFKIVSLSSILSSFAAVVCVWISGAQSSAVFAAGVFSLLILLRHGENIRMLRSGTERRIHWLQPHKK